jgi:hypothetical protein
MPPLERHSFTPISDASVSAICNEDSNSSHTLDNSDSTRRAATDACGLQPPRSTTSASISSPRRISISPSHLNNLVLAERDVIIDSKTFYEQSSSNSGKSADPKVDFCGTTKNLNEPLDLIDMFLSNLCVGPCAPVPQPTSKSQQQQKEQQQQQKERGQQQKQQPQRPTPVQLKKRRKQIVYPIAKYGSNTNLDNKCLVEQRRRSLEQHLFFRPVQCSETEQTDEHESSAKKAKLDP